MHVRLAALRSGDACRRTQDSSQGAVRPDGAGKHPLPNPEEYPAARREPASTTYPLAKVPKPRTGNPWRTLTDAELRIAELVAGGLTNRNIAEYLDLSPHTVDAHLKHTYTKLNIHSRVELTVLALQHH